MRRLARNGMPFIRSQYWRLTGLQVYPNRRSVCWPVAAGPPQVLNARKHTEKADHRRQGFLVTCQNMAGRGEYQFRRRLAEEI
jgi:hypothetical protein